MRLPIGAEGTWLQHVSLGPGRILLEGVSLDFESVTSLGRTLTTTFGGFKVKLEEIRELTIGQQTIFRFGYSVETEGCRHELNLKQELTIQKVLVGCWSAPLYGLVTLLCWP